MLGLACGHGWIYTSTAQLVCSCFDIILRKLLTAAAVLPYTSAVFSNCNAATVCAHPLYKLAVVCVGVAVGRNQVSAVSHDVQRPISDERSLPDGAYQHDGYSVSADSWWFKVSAVSHDVQRPISDQRSLRHSACAAGARWCEVWVQYMWEKSHEERDTEAAFGYNAWFRWHQKVSMWYLLACFLPEKQLNEAYENRACDSLGCTGWTTQWELNTISIVSDDQCFCRRWRRVPSESQNPKWKLFAVMMWAGGAGSGGGGRKIMRSGLYGWKNAKRL